MAYDDLGFVPDPTQNAGGIGNTPGDKRRMTDAQLLQTLLVQRNDPARDPGSTPELEREIARLQKLAGPDDLGFVPDKPAAPVPFVPSGEKATPSLLDPEMVAANPAYRFAKGAASPFLGLGQISGKMQDALYRAVGLPFQPGEAFTDWLSRAQQLQDEGRLKIGDKGVDLAEALGTVLSPAFLGLLKLSVAPTFMGKVAQGAGIGAIAGATAPVTDPNAEFVPEKLKQAAGGAVLGAALPFAVVPASKLAKMIYHGAIEPWAAPAAIKGRAYLEAAGDKVDDILNLLRNPQEIVPGSEPTAGQAATPAGRAEFAALQRSAEKVNPSAYVERADEQNAARLAAVRSVGKDKAALAAAETERADAAGPLYKAAYDATVERDPALRTLWNNPYFREAIPDAWRLAQANGVSPKTDLTQFLQYVKLSLDKQLSRAGDTALSSTEQRAVQGVKSKLVDWIEKKNPAYAQARATFAEKSEPINQMEVGQYLENKLVPALSDEAKQSAAAYSNALRDAPGTIKRSTGGPRFQELTDVLTPEQVQALEGVRDDLARNARFDFLAQKGAKAAPNALDLATESSQREAGGRIPNLLERGVMVANAIIERLQGHLNKKLAAELAAEMLNPSTVADSLAKARARAIFNDRVAHDIQQTLRFTTAGSIHQNEKR